MPKGVYDRAKAKKRAPQRGDILAAAMRVYAHYGFEGATISRIAQEVGVSNALIHAHFGDKQGLIQAAVSRSVEKNLQRIGEVDEFPSLSLREREERVFTIYKENRDEWRLIYGTLLVPNFQFEMRSVIESYLEEEYKNLLRYAKEFKDAFPESVRTFTYSMMGLRQQYVLDGRELDFLQARERLFHLFLTSG